LFAAIGRFSYRYRWVVVAVWAIAFVGGLYATTKLSKELKGGGFSNSRAPAQRALDAMQAKLHTGLSTLSVVFTSPDVEARSPQFQAAEAAALASITPATVPHLQGVQTYASTGDPKLISRDGKASVALLVFSSSLEQTQTQVARIRDEVRRAAQRAQAGGAASTLRGSVRLRGYVTGEPAVYADLENLSASDLHKAESYALPFALVVLLLIFGSVVAAALPVIGGGMAVTITLGVVYVLAQRFSMSIFVMNTASMLGLAVGIDYSLFIVGRFREELAGGATVADAVEATVAHAGRAIFFSGIAVIVGLLGLVAFQYMGLRSIGYGGSIVVFFSVASALTLLPAVLGILGPRVDSLRILGRGGHEGRFWQRWSDGVMAHPWLVLVATVTVILLFAQPIAHITVNVPTATSLPTSQESRQGYDILQQRFNRGALSPIAVMVTWGGGDQQPLASVNLAALYEFGHELAKQPGVASVSSVVNQQGLGSAQQVIGFWQLVQTAHLVKGSGNINQGPGVKPPGTPPQPSPAQIKGARRLAAASTAPGAVLFTVAPAADPTSTAAQRLAVDISKLRPPDRLGVRVTTIRDQTPVAAPARVWVAGLSAGVHDFLTALYSRFPWVILYIVVVTFIVLLVLLRSVVLPLKAVLMNTLSILASFGALVYVFQDGHFERLLQFTSAGDVDATLPVIMFCTIFGVSMDYEVFLLTRMREEWLETHDNLRAVGFGLTKTGRIITSAALIIVIVAGSFAFTSILITKAMGVGLAVAIALDASIIRILLVPATMRILGWVNWWMPKWLDRILPRIGEIEPGGPGHAPANRPVRA